MRTASRGFRLRFGTVTRTKAPLLTSATTGVRLLSDRDAQIPLRCNDAGLNDYYCPPKPRRTEPESDDRSIGGQGRCGRDRRPGRPEERQQALRRVARTPGHRPDG